MKPPFTKLFAALVTLAALLGLAGCASGPTRIERGIYDVRTNFTDQAVVRTNTVVTTNIVASFETNVVNITNAVGEISQVATVRPHLDYVVTTNHVITITTNQVASSVDYHPRPAVEAGLSAGGSLAGGLFGAGGLASTVLVGLYHAYASFRSRKINRGLAQVIETGRELLATTPQGQKLDAEYVDWMEKHQTVAGYVNTAAKLASAVDNDTAQAVARLLSERAAKPPQPAL